jgi:transcription termination/antitermination protein NusG
MDEPQANADDETPAMNGDENAAADAPVESTPATESSESQVSAQADTSVDIAVVAEEPEAAPKPAQSSRRRQQADDDDDVYIPPVKPETMSKSEAGARPALPSHMNEDDTPRDPATIPLHWYVLKVQSNREKSIRDNLVRRIKRDGYSDYFGEIVIPTEKVVETKGGKRKIREQKLFPGYMMIQVRLTDETWFLVRDTSGVGDFTGAAGRPLPMQEHEIERMLGAQTVAGEEEKPHRPVVKFSVAVGDVVKVKEGAFESFEGAVDSMDETTGKVKVIIEIFGRPTEVELEHWQVEKA